MSYNQHEYPMYRLLKPFYAEDDVLYQEDTELTYDGCPNEWMEPLNELARRRLEAYLPSITKKTLDERVYDAMRDRPRVEAMQQQAVPMSAPSQVPEVQATIVMPKKQADVPLMPNMNIEGQKPHRGPGRPKKVLAAQVPHAGVHSLRPKKAMGTVIIETPIDNGIPTNGI